ncbi:hypothetical protein [Haloplanus natans]|uniref:hypothetical protein n=1 Tax=Haloplanus natans TaxID=376171 RepID=UPI0012F73A41|nr:hypothetical protein [Haloplanus natans]
MSSGLTETVLDTLPARIAVIDGRGRIVESNAAWRAFVADHDHPLVPTDDDRPYLDTLRRSQNGQAVTLAGRLEALFEGESEASGEYPTTPTRTARR